jgi:hypothetical protein
MHAYRGQRCSTLLDVARRCSTLLDVDRRCSTLLDVARCSTLLDVARRCSTLLDVARRCSTLLDVARRCSTLLDVALRTPLQGDSGRLLVQRRAEVLFADRDPNLTKSFEIDQNRISLDQSEAARGRQDRTWQIRTGGWRKSASGGCQRPGKPKAQLRPEACP